MKALLNNTGGISDGLINGPYAREALPPGSAWLDDEAPDAPGVRSAIAGSNLTIVWSPASGEEVFRWVVYVQRGNTWTYDIHNRTDRNCIIPLMLPKEEGGDADPETAITQIAVSAVDRMGNESAKSILDITR